MGAERDGRLNRDCCREEKKAYSFPGKVAGLGAGLAGGKLGGEGLCEQLEVRGVEAAASGLLQR